MKGFKQKNPKNWIFPFPFCHTLPIDLDKCGVVEFSPQLLFPRVVDFFSPQLLSHKWGKLVTRTGIGMYLE